MATSSRHCRGSRALKPSPGNAPPEWRSAGLESGAQEAELVAFWIGQDVPAFCAGLADVGGPGAEREQSLQLGVLVAVGEQAHGLPPASKQARFTKPDGSRGRRDRY